MLRRVFRHPASAAVIVLTVGLAVGVVATIFTAFDAVLLRDLPVRDADRLVRVAAITPRGSVNDVMSASDFEALRHAFGPITVAAFTSGQEFVRDPHSGVLATAGVHRVSGRFFEVAGVRMVRGYGPRAGERAAVVSERFASLREIVVDGVTYSVAGVAAFRGMNFASPADVFLPLENTPRVRVIGRLAAGASYADAERALNNFLPDTRVTAAVRVGAERAMLINPEAPRMVTAATLVAALLALAAVLVAAANVVGILFARVATRRRELAVRMALGATRGQVAGQIVLETLPLALPAALLAYLVAAGGSRVYTAFLPMAIAPAIDFAPGARVAVFALVMSLLATLFAALAAAIHARGTGSSELASRGTAPRVPRSLRALVVAQLAFTVVVLIVAALLVQTARAYGNVDPGFEYDRQLTVDLPANFMDGMPRLRELADRLRQTPGVTHVAIAANTPLGRQTPASIAIDGETRDALVSRIEGDFFGSVGIPLLRGRHLTRGEEGVAVVNQTAGVDVGGRLTVDGTPVTVVGVVRDARWSALAERPRPYVWLPWSGGPARLQVRATRDLGAVTHDLTAVLAATGVRATIAPLEATVDSDRWLARTASVIAGALGALTLLLAAIGLFGVISTTVTTRLREIAVRMALGATRRNVGLLVARASGRFLVLGIVCGAALAVPAARLLGGLLFGVHAFDAASWAVPAVVITAVVALATLLPMLRAMRAEPEALLREI